MFDLIAPIYCLACGAAAGGELCGSCAIQLRVLCPAGCSRCGVIDKPNCCGGAIRRIRSVLEYDRYSARLVLALKRRGRTALAKTAGSLMAQISVLPTVVTHVPGGRKAARNGFDHAELLAKYVARTLKVSRRRLLVRTKQGSRQSEASATQRRTNISGRFRSKRVRGNVLLVDDVFTTGATAEACAAALRAAGAREVDVVTFARTQKRVRIMARR